MKIIFTIEDTPEGDVLLLMDPPIGELMLLALGGGSTMACSCALTAFQHVLQALVELHGPEQVQTGERPATVH